MKILIPFALAGAVSFTAVALSTASAEPAPPSGDRASDVALTPAEADLSVRLLEDQVGARMSKIGATLAEFPRRRLLSRAAPRPEDLTTVVVFSFERPAKASSVVLGSKTVSGSVTLRKPDKSRVQVPYRIGLTKNVVELRRGDEWVPASAWTPVDQKAADPAEKPAPQKASRQTW